MPRAVPKAWRAASAAVSPPRTLDERPARRRVEAMHQERDAPKIAADDVVLLSREAGEILPAHASRLQRGKVGVTPDLLLDELQFVADLLDQQLSGGHVGVPDGPHTHRPPDSRASLRVTC